MRTTLYLCAALLGTAISASAQNTIVHTAGPSFSITTDTNSALDLDSDGVTDFEFGAVFISANFATNGTLITNLPLGGITGDFFISSLNSNAVLCTNSEVVIMPAGTVIGDITPPGAVWNTSVDGGTLALEGIAFGDPPITTWYGPLGAPPQEGFFGVRFNIQNELHYGWVHTRLQTNDGFFQPGPIILDWAYETRPNTPIVAGVTTSATTVEWHFLGLPPAELPVPTSLALIPANPTITSLISFVSPADGETYLNSSEAASVFGNPLIAVDPTNRTVTVTFTPPTMGPVFNLVLPVNGVDGQFGPLAAGTWTFQVLTNSFTFTVAGPPLTIAQTGKQIVLSWPSLATNYALQTATDPASGNWSNITNPITTNADAFIFTSTIGSQPAAFYRLKQQ